MPVNPAAPTLLPEVALVAMTVARTMSTEVRSEVCVGSGEAILVLGRMTASLDTISVATPEYATVVNLLL